LLFERARRVDPGYGRAYAALSRTFNLDWRYAWSRDPVASLDRALELAELALRYDPLDARGHAELGFACLYRKQHDASLAAYERAVELNPNDADILAEMGDALACVGENSAPWSCSTGRYVWIRCVGLVPLASGGVFSTSAIIEGPSP
jgi:tetratricopeptide (TPR) repeat protein